MKRLDQEGIQLLARFEKEYQETKQSLLSGGPHGFSGKQSARQDLMSLGERLKAIGAGFRPSRRVQYNTVIFNGRVLRTNPFEVD